MAELHILSWRDIPIQVIATEGTRNVTHDLSRRFIEAVDRAAAREGIESGLGDRTQWRRGSPITCGDDLVAEAEAVAERIEQGFDPKMLAELSAAGGRRAG